MSVRDNLGYNTMAVPVGSIIPYFGDVAPRSWLLCSGASFEIDDPIYAELYGVLGISFNTGATPLGYFSIPDMINNHFLVGSAITSGTPLPTNPTTTTTYTLLEANLPSLSSANFTSSWAFTQGQITPSTAQSIATSLVGQSVAGGGTTNFTKADSNPTTNASLSFPSLLADGVFGGIGGGFEVPIAPILSGSLTPASYDITYIIKAWSQPAPEAVGLSALFAFSPTSLGLNYDGFHFNPPPY